MTRCSDCGATLDSISELARHECEPTYPTEEEGKRIRAAGRRRSAEEQEARRERYELEFEWR